MRAGRTVEGVPSGRRLQTSENEQDEDDHEQHPDNAAWSVTPAPRVRPHRNDAQERQHKDDQENRTDAHTLYLAVASRRGGPRIDDDLWCRVMAVVGTICTLPHVCGENVVGGCHIPLFDGGAPGPMLHSSKCCFAACIARSSR